ncbi:M23 family metallopeptidase [Brevibacillus marinus]|uniref:M23 family metallopeptidase n=1 Tax=Brevibacillus marinus TaxID=2496837 RepID=UPI000F82CB84|nr:M23 family metallopeptidase [Brevibacillus marinus]
MFDEVERVRERRRERVEQIRMQARDSLPPYIYELNDPFEDSYTTVEQILGRRHDRYGEGPRTRAVLGLQVMGALLLIGAAYLLFQTSLPFPSPWKETAREIMTRDFNFAGVATWYESRFGHTPSVLPVLTPKQSPDPAFADQSAWQFPQGWRLVKPYDPASAKLVIDVGEDGRVVNGETGWVTFVGEKAGFGTTIVVRLASQREAWYGNLEAVNVSVNDWVNPGDQLGRARTFTGSSRYLYLALRQNDQFVDPLDVITLE